MATILRESPNNSLTCPLTLELLKDPVILPNGTTVSRHFIEESIDLESAIDAFTINAAFINNLEKETGSIEVGKYADLVVLDQNLFEIEVYDISETKALLTLFEGRVVHGNVEEL